jgi:hypothetical protein
MRYVQSVPQRVVFGFEPGRSIRAARIDAVETV